MVLSWLSIIKDIMNMIIRMPAKSKGNTTVPEVITPERQAYNRAYIFLGEMSRILHNEIIPDDAEFKSNLKHLKKLCRLDHRFVLDMVQTSNVMKVNVLGLLQDCKGHRNYMAQFALDIHMTMFYILTVILFSLEKETPLLKAKDLSNYKVKEGLEHWHPTKIIAHGAHILKAWNNELKLIKSETIDPTKDIREATLEVQTICQTLSHLVATNPQLNENIQEQGVVTIIKVMERLLDRLVEKGLWDALSVQHWKQLCLLYGQTFELQLSVYNSSDEQERFIIINRVTELRKNVAKQVAQVQDRFDKLIQATNLRTTRAPFLSERNKKTPGKFEDYTVRAAIADDDSGYLYKVGYTSITTKTPDN